MAEFMETTTPWPNIALGWSNRADKPFRLAVGSILQAVQNEVTVMEAGYAGRDGKLRQVCTIRQPGGLPTTKVAFHPSIATSHRDLLMSVSASSLHLWDLSAVSEKGGEAVSAATIRYGGTGAQGIGRGSDVGASGFGLGGSGGAFGGRGAPTQVSSFDWSSADPNRVVASAFDGSCCVWDLAQAGGDADPVLQINAHKDGMVQDVAWSPADGNVFATAGLDGQVLCFDTRDDKLNESLVLFETSDVVDTTAAALGAASSSYPPRSVARVAWNSNSNMIAAVPDNSPSAYVVDARTSGVLAELRHPAGNYTTSVAWAPHSANHLCTTTDSGLTYIWDLSRLPVDAAPVADVLPPDHLPDPFLKYKSPAAVASVEWSVLQPDWIALSGASRVEVLRT